MCRPDHNHYSIHDHSSIASLTVTSPLDFKGVIFVDSTSTNKRMGYSPQPYAMLITRNTKELTQVLTSLSLDKAVSLGANVCPWIWQLVVP